MQVISKLITLQEIDSQLQELNDLLGDLPLKVEGLKTEETALLNSVKEGKARIKELEVELSKSELAMMEIREKIAKLKEQLFLVTTNKQYDALQHEIDHLKEELETIEDQSLDYEEEKETLEEKVKSEEANLETLSNDLVSRRKRLEKLMAESAEEKQKLENRRKTDREAIDPAILRRYDRIYTAREGLVVVALETGACGGCGSRVPPQKISEIRTGSYVHTCDVCSRFLYWDESS